MRKPSAAPPAAAIKSPVARFKEVSGWSRCAFIAAALLLAAGSAAGQFRGVKPNGPLVPVPPGHANLPLLPVSGNQFVVPNSLATVEGNNNNGFPFSISDFSLSSQRYQQVYAAAQFPAVPITITKIAFRPDAFAGAAFSTTLPLVRIDLSTTSAAPDGLSTTFSDNVGADNTIVFGGAGGASLMLSSAFTGPVGGPEAFDVIINLTMPFLYDPSKGNLLLDVRNFSGGSTTQFDAQAAGGDPISRIYTFDEGVDATTVSPDNVDTLGLVTQFTTAVVPPTITKAFGAASIPLDGTTTLSFTITNPPANFGAPLSGVGFTDSLPAGLVAATPNGLTGSCGGGAITAVAGSGSISLSGATLAVGASCTFSVRVTGTSAGIKNNTTSAVTSTEGGTGTTSNTASLTVIVMPPAISKSFGAAEIPLGGTTSLSFTVTNPNPFAPLTGVVFTDTLPAGLMITGGRTTTGLGCVFAPVLVTSTSFALTGATISPGGFCIVTLSVMGTAIGLKTNVTGAVSSTEGGAGGTAMASVTVFDGPDVTVSKSHTGSFVRGEEGAQYSIAVGSVGSKPTSGTVTVADTLPAGLTATAISGTGWACVLGTLTCTRSDALAVGISYPPIIVTVNVSLTAALLVTNTAMVSGGGDVNLTNNTATDPTAVLPCAAHTVHGHVTTTPPNAHDADSHIHHGQHGHNIIPGTECLPTGHHVTVNGHILGLTPESQDGLFARDSLAAAGPDFVAILNQDGNSAPAQRGQVIQLFGSANGLFFDSADQEPVLRFTPPASGLPLYYTTSLPEVLIGGVPGDVLFSGLAPGLRGVWQINVRIPDGTQSGKVPVTIAHDGEALTSVDLAVE